VVAPPEPEEPEPEEVKPEQPNTNTTAGLLNGIKLTALVTEVGVKFDWTPGNNALGYRIYRSSTPGGAGISISDFPIVRVNEYVDVNVNENSQYYYTIRAVTAEASLNRETRELTAEQAGAASEELSVSTGAIKPQQPGTGNFILMHINEATMQVNEDTVEIDPGRGTTPVILNGRTMVPIRAIIETIGGEVEWNDPQISLSANDHIVDMWLQQKDIVVDGVPAEVDIAPQSVNDRTMLPLRFVAENTGCQIDWIGSENAIIVVFYTK
jgi:hypothetical protein